MANVLVICSRRFYSAVQRQTLVNTRSVNAASLIQVNDHAPRFHVKDGEPSERDAYLHHLRNVLSVIRALIRRTTDSEDGERFAWLDGKIGAFARVQSAAARDPKFKVELRTLIDEEVNAALLSAHVATAGGVVWLGAQAAGLIALLFHGFLCSIVGVPREGTVKIRWSRADIGGLTIAFEAGQVERDIAMVEDMAWLADAINYELGGMLDKRAGIYFVIA